MTPFDHFSGVWYRCDQLSQIYSTVTSNSSLNSSELLRAEWVARISALDLYVHELVAQRMLLVFQGSIPATQSYLKFQIANETMGRIRAAANAFTAEAAFDLDVRTQLSSVTYQSPDAIADGVRLISAVELWNEVAMALGATPATKTTEAKKLKKELSLLVQRRNKIAHEGDLQPSAPRQPWSITQADLAFVKDKLEDIVLAIETVVT